MITDLYNNSAKVIDKVEIPDRVFGVSWNPDLVKQALDAQRANARQPLAHTKDRGDVSGGGKKPWRQKGTGRARHGSTRSPIWKGGGVAHGPRKEKIFSVKINKKMKQAAIFSVLSKKLEDGEVKVVDSLSIAEPKTKLVSGIVRAFSAVKPSALIVPSLSNKNIYRASSNIPKVKSVDPKSLNVYDLLRYKNILIEKDAVAAINDHYNAFR
ncbi:MAG: 50S ribosomal protein L4 [Candidatus Colwellbacteria bacterium]|nr:50S ribosomal protein L4 [Candidatus Colwellbacteria bacterium]